MDVEYFESPVFQRILLFRCERLRADLTAQCCARNFTGATALACIDCPVGRRHAEVLPDAVKHRASRWNVGAPLACVRCGRDGTTAGARMVGRIRLVRAHTLCMTCYNREREFVHGRNAKGARPVKWSGLRQAHVEIRLHGKQQRHDVGLRSCRTEIERFVARRWPEASIIRVWLDAEPPAIVPAHRPIGPGGGAGEHRDQYARALRGLSVL